MLALLSSLVWSAPAVEESLRDVAREMRCVRVEPREEPATEPCVLCFRPLAPGVWICAGCELACRAPEAVA